MAKTKIIEHHFVDAPEWDIIHFDVVIAGEIHRFWLSGFIVDAVIKRLEDCVVDGPQFLPAIRETIFNAHDAYLKGFRAGQLMAITEHPPLV